MHYWSRLRDELAAGDRSARETVYNFLQDLASEHNIVSLDDWYALSPTQIGETYSMALDQLGKLPHVLELVYPDHQWEKSRFATGGKRGVQRVLSHNLQDLLPSGNTQG